MKTLETFLANIAPPLIVIRILRFAAFTCLHSESLKTLKELKIISEPYLHILNSLEKAAEANKTLLVTMLSSDKKLKIDLATEAYKENNEKSIKDAHKDLCDRMLSENTAFYAQRKRHLENYLANLRRLPENPEHDKEMGWVETEIQNFTSLLSKLIVTSEPVSPNP